MFAVIGQCGLIMYRLWTVEYGQVWFVQVMSYMVAVVLQSLSTLCVITFEHCLYDLALFEPSLCDCELYRY